MGEKRKEITRQVGYGSALPSTWSGQIRWCRRLCPAAQRAARSLLRVLDARGSGRPWRWVASGTASQGVRCIPAAGGPQAPGTLPGPRTGARLTWPAAAGAAGGRTGGSMGGPGATPAAARGIEGGAAEEELRSRGRAGRFVSTAHGRPYVTMATARAGAGREPEPPLHQGPGPLRAVRPTPFFSAVGLHGEDEDPTPHPTLPESLEPLATETGRLQRALSPEADLIAAYALLCFLIVDLPKPEGLPSSARLSPTELCPRSGNSLKRGERVIQSDRNY